MLADIDDPITLFFNKNAQGVLFLFVVKVCITQNDVVIINTTDILCTTHHFCIERVGNIRDHDSQSVGLLDFQASRNGIRLIPSFFDGLQHAFLCLFIDQRNVVYNTRYCCHRYVCFFCNINNFYFQNNTSVYFIFSILLLL